MNAITKETSLLYEPQAALIVYGCDDINRCRKYLEIRQIDRHGRLGAGKPVSVDFIKELSKSVASQNGTYPRGCIPRRLLFADIQADHYVWVHPSCRKQLYFSEQLNIPDGEYMLPNLIFCVRQQQLNVFACKTRQPLPETQVCSAPFFNVRPDSGEVCLGNGKLAIPTEPTFQDMLHYWESLFFLTEFSHILGGNPTKGNLVTVMKNSTEKFDNDELIPIPELTFNDLLK